MKARTNTETNEILQELFADIVLSQQLNEIEFKDEEVQKNRCSLLGIKVIDCVGWSILALHELINLNKTGLLSTEKLSEILVLNGWVEAYEHITKQIVFVREEAALPLMAPK